MKRRARSPHPGVVLLDPKKQGRKPEHKSWRARYRDITGEWHKVTLERVDAKAAETRKAWAQRLSEQLQRARSDAKAGVLRTVEDIGLNDAVKRYFEAHPRLAPATRRVYQDSISTLMAGREKLTTAQLTPAVLVSWRTARSSAPKRSAKRGGTRGDQRVLSRLRSPHSVNRELRAVAAILEYWRRAGLVRLSRDDIADALKREKAPVERKEFLEPEQIRLLLGAAERHDTDTFKETQKEHRKEGVKGTTPRYKPIAPFIRFLLLTGLRVSEALAIEWRDVVGTEKIRVRAAVAKTKQTRDVDLTVAPTALPSQRGDGRIFTLTAGEVLAAQRRLIADYEAPDWSPQVLRRTCSTYFTNAFNAWRSAKSIGHSVVIAERHYAGLVKVPAGCATLEAAMGLG